MLPHITAMHAIERLAVCSRVLAQPMPLRRNTPHRAKYVQPAGAKMMHQTAIGVDQPAVDKHRCCKQATRDSTQQHTDTVGCVVRKGHQNFELQRDCMHVASSWAVGV